MSAAIPISAAHEPSHEMSLVAAAFLDVSVIDRVSSVVQLSDFADPNAECIWSVLGAHREAVFDPSTGIVHLKALHDLIDKSQGEISPISHADLAEISDFEATPAFAMHFARKVREASLRRSIHRRLRDASADPSDLATIREVERLQVELVEIEAGMDGASTSIGFSGEALEEIASESEVRSPLPGYFDPEPSLHVVHGVAKTGKTTFAWGIGLAWSLGLSPWRGAPAFDGSRVLILSAEQPARKCVRVLHRVGRSSGFGELSDWKDRITVVARRAKTSPVEQSLLKFDESGLAGLRTELRAACGRGDPYGLIVADSLSRMKPAGSKLNDNDDMVVVLDELAQIATEFGVYVLLVHHDGHNADRQGKAIDGVRGASVIRDVPQVLMAVSKVTGNPRQRRIEVAGNEVADLAEVFDVANVDEPEGEINRFVPTGNAVLDLDEIFCHGPLGLTDFGRKALGWAAGKAPSGHAKETAKKLLESFVDQGLIRKKGRNWDLVEKSDVP